MPRYHFHIHDGVSIPDPVGRDLADLAAAQRAAIRFAAETIEQIGDFWSGHEWRLEVADPAGLTLFLLDFVGTLAPAAQLYGASGGSPGD